MILRFDGPTQVLLIRRSEHPADPWSGHMAFPGGRMEPTDRTAQDAAVRETREEVGIDLSTEAELLGRLDDVTAMARGRELDLVIVPFVFSVQGSVTLRPNDEVDEVLWAPLEPMAEGRVDTTRPYRVEGHELDLPAYQVGPHVVWGLTYRMLSVLFAKLRA